MAISALDWLVLFGTVACIVGIGLWQERGVRTTEMYIRGGRQMRWWTIGLSIMATQASAITFLSMPGQAYEDGMGFVQFYFGLPIAMVLLAAFVVPIYYNAKVYTAYEYLEGRFDRKTRQLTALLFLISRGLAAGISIYAPAIVLSAVLGWPLQLLNVLIGGVVILYTVSGGTRVVSRTQTYQMVVMLGGMAAAAVVLWSQLPPGLSFAHTLAVAKVLGRLDVVDTSLRFDTRYTLLSGLTGGLFVALAYFGTDQSQVQRYLGGASLQQSKQGLWMTAVVKVPMQFLILFVGVLLFVFYQFHAPPVFFAKAQWAEAHAGAHAAEAQAIDADWQRAFSEKRVRIDDYVRALDHGDSAAAAQALSAAARKSDAVRSRAKALVPVKDADYMFIGFVVEHFPPGLVGLLLAVILCASMSAVAAALSSLGTTSVVDFYRVSIKPGASDGHYLRVAKALTIFWGVLAVGFAAFAGLLDNLIQAVNILGSIFYGPMLGVFVVGFFLRWVRATPVFIAALCGQAVVVAVFAWSNIGFLWYNVIGCLCVVALALLLQALGVSRPAPAASRAP